MASDDEVLAAMGVVHDELAVRRALDDRWRQIVGRLLAVSMVALLLLLGCMAGLVVTAVGNRGVLREVERTAREVRDCTSPDVASDCQRRIQASQSQGRVIDDLKEDNLRASQAVGSCLRDPDMVACSDRRYAELSATTTTLPP